MVILAILSIASCRKIEETNLNSSVVSNAVSSASDGRPNVIMILTDDVGYEIPSYTGGQSYDTHNLDALAAVSARFSNAFGTPLCTPSRVELLTGKYGFRNYVKWGYLDSTQNTFASLLRSNGYSTCLAGKWQLDGGDASIRAAGFDTYLAWEVYNRLTEDQGNKYKSPKLFSNGAYLPDSLTEGRYCEDMYKDFIINFMDTVKSPFLVYYPMAVCHVPFQPTPDDPQFATWNNDSSNNIFFPSMVKYMDKMIDSVIEHAPDNTIIMWTGDNGTTRGIYSQWNNETIRGGKGKTILYGIHQPVLVYWKGHSIPHTDTSLINFADMFPTIAELAGVTIPSNFGLDGVSFAPQVLGNIGNPRTYSYCWWNPNPRSDTGDIAAWTQYPNGLKKYDTIWSNVREKGKIYNDVLDGDETNPLKINSHTPDYILQFSNFSDSIFSVMHN